MLPAIERLEGTTVHLVDGQQVEADVIICATGYEMTFPFFDDGRGASCTPTTTTATRCSSG